MICPKCKNSKLVIVRDSDNSNENGTNTYICKECHFSIESISNNSPNNEILSQIDFTVLSDPKETSRILNSISLLRC